MKDVRMRFTKFHDDYVKFSNELPSKLKPNAPEKPLDTSALAVWFKPTDLDTNDQGTIKSNLARFIDVTKLILETIEEKHLLVTTEKFWFDRNKYLLNNGIYFTQRAIEMDMNDVVDEDVVSGAGGINGGKSSTNRGFEEVRQLIKALVGLKSNL